MLSRGSDATLLCEPCELRQLIPNNIASATLLTFGNAAGFAVPILITPAGTVLDAVSSFKAVGTTIVSFPSAVLMPASAAATSAHKNIVVTGIEYVLLS